MREPNWIILSMNSSEETTSAFLLVTVADEPTRTRSSVRYSKALRIFF
jgi:hypothetical protein